MGGFTATTPCATRGHTATNCQAADEVIGYTLVYVDDAMVIGSTSLVETVFDVYKSMWDVKVTGILGTDGVPTEHEVSAIKFLGCTLKRRENMFTLDQVDYIEERLLERGYDKVAGKKNIPDVQ